MGSVYTPTWSPAPMSSSLLPPCTPWAISVDCFSIATRTLQVLKSKPKDKFKVKKGYRRVANDCGMPVP